MKEPAIEMLEREGFRYSSKLGGHYWKDVGVGTYVLFLPRDTRSGKWEMSYEAPGTRTDFPPTTARGIMQQLRGDMMRRVSGDRSRAAPGTRGRRPRIMYWLRSSGGGEPDDFVRVYVYGPTDRADEGMVGVDMRIRPTRLGPGSYTSVVDPDSLYEGTTPGARVVRDRGRSTVRGRR